MEETKPFNISKQLVKVAFERVKANRGTYGIDEQSIADFEENLKDNLYKIWNRIYKFINNITKKCNKCP